jgi:hypothetical protein
MSGLDQLLETTRSAEFEDSGGLRLIAASWSAADLTLRFELDDGQERFSVWELECTWVLEQLLSKAYECGLNVWYEDHPILDQYTTEWESLAFSRAPRIPDRVVGQLWTAHREAVDDWIDFDRYLNDAMPLAEVLRSPSGIVATGPAFLIDAYEQVLRRNRCEPSRVPSGRKQIEAACLVHFEESYVVAERVTARLVSG